MRSVNTFGLFPLIISFSLCIFKQSFYTTSTSEPVYIFLFFLFFLLNLPADLDAPELSGGLAAWAQRDDVTFHEETHGKVNQSAVSVRPLQRHGRKGRDDQVFCVLQPVRRWMQQKVYSK